MLFSIPVTSLLLVLGGASGLAQPASDPPTEAILAEGLNLYQAERAAWVATDLLLASTLDRSQVGGYLSYFRGDSVSTIFWAKGSAGSAGASLLGTYTFPRQDVRVETHRSRPQGTVGPAVARLLAIRQAALAAVNAGHYPVPANASLNLDLLEDPSGDTRAYFLVGPRESRVVPIGGDLLLTFDQAGRLKATERLHNSYLPLRWAAGQDSIVGMTHTHLPAHPYITPTDICSVLLYQPPGCQQHIVAGERYVSIFDIRQRQLLILTRKAWERIANFEH